MKIAILHDYFNSLGGGERLVLKLAKFFDADIYTYFLNKAKTYKEVENSRIETAKLPLKYYGLRQFLGIKHFEKLNLQSDYDLFIMSGYLSIFASELNHPNIWISGSALKHLFVGGSAVFETDDFTRSGKAITFITAPPNGARISNPSYRRS